MIRRVFRKHPVRTVLVSLCILTFIGLQFRDNDVPLPIHDWNKKEISRIKVGNPEDFAFAVFGDNKGNRAVFEPLLRDIGHNPQIAMAIDVGDLVKEGKRAQFRHFLSQVQENLSIPLVAAIGNHDLVVGPDPFREIFGPTYYAFRVGQSSFIVLDAHRESAFDQGQRQWLEEELQNTQSSKTRFVFMHVPPFDPRGKGFDKCLREKDGEDLLNLFRQHKVTHLFASHIHGYFSGVWKGVPYTITGGAGGGLQGRDPEHFFYHYVTVRVADGKAEVAVRRVGAENILGQILDRMKDDRVESGLLIGAAILLVSLGLSMRRRPRTK